MIVNWFQDASSLECGVCICTASLTETTGACLFFFFHVSVINRSPPAFCLAATPSCNHDFDAHNVNMWKSVEIYDVLKPPNKMLPKFLSCQACYL